MFLRNLLLILLNIPYMWWILLSCYFKIFSLASLFDSLIIMCLSVDLFEFYILGICWASWMFIFMILSNLISFWPLVLQRISQPFLSPSEFPSEIPQCIGWSTECVYNSLRLCLLFFNLFSFCSSDSIISIVLCSISVILSSACSYCPWISLVKFSFHYCTY